MTALASGVEASGGVNDAVGVGKGIKLDRLAYHAEHFFVPCGWASC